MMAILSPLAIQVAATFFDSLGERFSLHENRAQELPRVNLTFHKISVPLFCSRGKVKNHGINFKI